MVRELSRRNLIRGRFVQPPKLPLPPYAISETEFRSSCDQCGDCLTACETGIIGKDANGFPVLRFGHAKCTFCGACADVCQTGALSPQVSNWTIRAHIDKSCLSLKGITCRTCEESCEVGAIRFQLMTGGRALALVDADMCTGCGNCATVCPSKSIEMTNPKTEEMVA